MSATASDRPTGNVHDPIWEAYDGSTPDQQQVIRDLFSTSYTDGEMAASLTYFTGVDVTARDVDSFRRKLAQGRVAW